MTSVLGLLGAVGTYTSYNLNHLANLTTSLYEHPFAVSNAVLHIKLGIRTMDQSLQEVISTQNDRELAVTLQLLEQTNQEILQDFNVIQSQFLGDPQTILRARQTFTQWQLLRDRIIALRQAHQIEAATTLLKTEETLYIQKMLQEMDEVETFAADKALTFLNEAQKTRENTLRFNTVILGLTLGLTTLWVIWMHRLLENQRRTQGDLKMQSQRSEALLKLPWLAEQWDEITFMQQGQEIAEDLTHSQISFIHFINDDEETIELVTWSRRTLERYCSAVYDRHYPVSSAGIWADALRERRAIVINNYPQHPQKKGLPAHHAALTRLISVPVIEAGRVVMLTGVGNKATAYTDWDVDTVQLISNEIWRIVQRHRNLTRLTASERQLREAQQLARLGSWELNHPTGELTWSDGVFRIFELDRGEIPPPLSYETFLSQVHPDDRDVVHRTYQESLAKQTSYQIVHRIYTKDRRVKYVQERGEHTYGEGNKPLWSLGTVQDITDTFLAEEKLREAAMVFRSTSEGVTITDLNGTILNVNAAFSAITGYSAEEAIGKNPRILKSNRHDRSFYEEMWHRLTTEGTWRGEIWNRHKDGKIYPELLTINRIQNEQGQGTGYVAVFSDISAAKEAEHKLYTLAHHNSLTHLPNRRLLHLRLEQSIQHALDHRTLLGILFIDLDRFKQINDSLGHSTGDALIKEVSQRLVKTFEQDKQDSLVAHINGDEFVVVLQVQHTFEIVDIVNNLRTRLMAPFHLRGQDIYITCSIGISCFPQHGKTAEILLRNADTAMYQAKAQGRNTSCFYVEEMTLDALYRVQMETALQVALKRDEFHLVYQLQVDFKTHTWNGMEVLLRWQHPEMGMVPPDRFIPLAEQNGLIQDIGTWVLRRACIQGKYWLDQGFEFGRIAVNVAGPQIQGGGFVAIVQDILDETGFPAQYLELEVTEGFVMQQPEERIRDLKQLRLMGIQLAIDDFGTGYSSLSYLKQLPINQLKIDQSFVRHIPFDPDDMAIVEAIIAMGKALNLKIIAEGVETLEQALFLQERGCHSAQGYLYSRPLPIQAIEALLSAPPPNPMAKT